MTTRKKIQLVLDEEAQATLERLVESTSANSMAEVLRDALGVYSSLREMMAAASGTQKKLALVDRSAGEMQELIIPSLMRGTAIVPVAVAAMPLRRTAAAAAQPATAAPPERLPA